MKISVCIPQHNRCAYLLAALESIRAQTYKDLEVVVSDDASTDNSRAEVPNYLAQSGMQYKYIEQEKNLGYDGNLRASLGGASGDYLFILTNDDAIPDPGTLERVAALLEEHKPDLVIGNVTIAHTGASFGRVNRTRAVTGDPDCAVTMFRALSCVTGLIFSRKEFERLNTPRYDGSVYVQMYLGASIIAGGGRLLTIEESIAHIGMSVGGVRANSYREILGKFRRKILPATGGLDEVGRVVCEAIWPHVPTSERPRITRAVFSQILTSSYAFWLYDYRLNGAPWAAFNLALGCSPSRLLGHTDRSLLTRASLALPYLGATSSMLVPLWLLGNMKDAVRSYAMRNR
jgi:glycosyltransferase involved in cell wall biosynthesis